MGILDILKGAQGQTNKAPTIPSIGGYSKADAKTAADMAKRMQTIDKLLNSSAKHWAKLGEARSLKKANDSMRQFGAAQRGFNAAMKVGNLSMRDRLKAYDKLATKRKKAIDDVKDYNEQLNEQKGILGRTQNVLNEMAEHKGMAIFTAAIRDAGIVLGDMNQGFDIMARTGQIQNQTMGQLAVSTGNYMAQMRLGSIQAAQFGITAEDSNAAFAKLTETFGGTGEAVDEMADKWSSMAAMAKLSGLGMADIATLADQNFKKLGETLDDTLNTVKDMAQVTGELNERFGEGSVNSKAFASAIQEMAYGASFMNQNSRMLTETLGRELQMQLALGRAPEAAMKKAQQNMEMAGKVNIVGITKFRDAMQAEWDALKTDEDRAAHLEKLASEFGSEGELIANMLEQNTLMSSDSLFAFEKAVKDSSALSANMLDSMRSSAASGDIGALLSVGLGIDEAQYMVAEAKLLTSKLEKLRSEGFERQAEAMFGKNWKSDPEAKKFVDSARGKGKDRKSMKQLHAEFRAMGAAGEGAADRIAAEAGAAGKPEWEVWADKNIGAAWFGGVTNSFNTITSLLSTLPISLAGVLGALLLRRGLGSALGNMGIPGMGRGAGMGGARTAMNFGGGRMAGMARGGATMALAAGLAFSVGKVAEGMFNATEIMGKADVSGIERLAAGFGNLISAVTGVDARDAAIGNTGFHKAIYSALGLDKIGQQGVDVNEFTREEDLTAQYQAHVRRTQKSGTEAMSEQDWREMVQRRKLQARAPAAAGTSGGDGTVKRGGDSGPAEVTGDGQLEGKELVIRIPNYADVHAEASYNEGSLM